MQWQYTTVTAKLKGFLGPKLDPESINDILNQLGSEGWELCSTVGRNEGYGATRDVYFFFKRPVG